MQFELSTSLILFSVCTVLNVKTFGLNSNLLLEFKNPLSVSVSNITSFANGLNEQSFESFILLFVICLDLLSAKSVVLCFPSVVPHLLFIYSHSPNILFMQKLDICVSPCVDVAIIGTV